MTDRLSLGVRLPMSGPFASADAILGTAARAEELGYETVWVNDHISWTRAMRHHLGAGSVEAVADQDPNFFESLSTLAVVGGRTRRVRLGIAGLVLPLRDPRVLGKQLGTTSELVGPGRLIAAIGIGNIPNDFEVMGVRWDRRGRITTDHLAAVRAVLAARETADFESPTLSFAGGSFYPHPRGLTVLVTGGVEAAFERIAAHGDGWLTANETPESYGEKLGLLRERVSAAGRDARALQTVYELFACVADTHEEALAIASRSLEARHRGDLAKALAVGAVGTVAEVREKLGRFRDAGVQHFELKFVCHSLAQLHLMMERTAA